jgi:hypothetical protein
MLVVIAILVTLMGILIPAVQKAREAASRAKCQAQMKQVVYGTIMTFDQYKKLPPAIGNYGGTTWQAGPTLFYHILPFIEAQDVYNQGTGSVALPVVLFRCPSDASNATTTESLSVGASNATFATSNYAANWSAFNGTTGGMRIPDSFPGGVSKTVFFTDRLADPIPTNGSGGATGVGNCWGYFIPPTLNAGPPPTLGPPYFAPFVGYGANGSGLNDDFVFLTQPTPQQVGNNPTSAASFHTGTINVAMGDSSVRAVARNYTGNGIGTGQWFQGLTPVADYYNWDD